MFHKFYRSHRIQFVKNSIAHISNVANFCIIKRKFNWLIHSRLINSLPLKNKTIIHFIFCHHDKCTYSSQFLFWNSIWHSSNPHYSLCQKILFPIWQEWNFSAINLWYRDVISPHPVWLSIGLGSWNGVTAKVKESILSGMGCTTLFGDVTRRPMAIAIAMVWSSTINIWYRDVVVNKAQRILTMWYQFQDVMCHMPSV